MPMICTHWFTLGINKNYAVLCHVELLQHWKLLKWKILLDKRYPEERLIFIYLSEIKNSLK